MFGSHSVYSRTLTEDIKCKWTKSFAQLDQFLPLLSTKPTVFNALGPGVFLFLFLFCWIQDRKQTLQSVLAFARDPPPPGGSTRSAQVLFLQSAGKAPVAKNGSTCAGSKMTIAMLVMSQILGAF